ncbi:MAG TPA: glycosyltransferase [Thermosynechococcus sp. M46_R2017_013]|nr:glycosyltransferase [Thermosynechococcus sp. M46_R2017_013]
MSRLILLARKLEQGGAQRQLITLAKALRDRGCDVHVVLFYAGGIFDSELTAAGVPIYFLGKHGRWDVVEFLVRLVLLLLCLQPEVIYSFLDVANILAVLVRPFIGSVRLIWSICAAGMEMHHYDWLARLVVRIEAVFSRAADVIVANSHAGKEWGFW